MINGKNMRCGKYITVVRVIRTMTKEVPMPIQYFESQSISIKWSISRLN